MSSKNIFEINHTSLGLGQHSFIFDLENDFFEKYTYSEFFGGKLNANVLLNKKTNFMELSIKLEGSISVLCDRCSVEYNHPFLSHTFWVVKQNLVQSDDEGSEDEPEILILEKNQNSIPLDNVFFEQIVVNLPFRKIGCEVLKNDTICDKTVLGYIENYSSETNRSIDPRWENLNKIKLN